MPATRLHPLSKACQFFWSYSVFLIKVAFFPRNDLDWFELNDLVAGENPDVLTIFRALENSGKICASLGDTERLHIRLFITFLASRNAESRQRRCRCELNSTRVA